VSLVDKQAAPLQLLHQERRLSAEERLTISFACPARGLLPGTKYISYLSTYTVGQRTNSIGSEDFTCPL
jgi:hypothetical protein